MNSSNTVEGASASAAAEHSAGLAFRFGISVGVVSLVIILIIAYYLCNYKRLQLLQPPPAAAAADNTQHSGDEDDDDDDVELGPAATTDFPRTRFSELGDCNNCCAICLGEFKDDDFVRQLPDCHHMFHVDCIARWLGLHGTCPLCRTSAVTATPHRFNFFIPFSR